MKERFIMFTVSDVIAAYTEDMTAVLENKKDSNRTKKAQRDRIIIQMLRTLPEDMLLSCEGTAIDPAKLNAGSVAEIALRFHFTHCPEDTVIMEKSGGVVDLSYKNGRGVEVKLCLNGSCYNTPIMQPMTVYLITPSGVFFIPKKPLEEMLEISSKLPYKEDVLLEYEGVRKLKTLSKALGFEV